MNPFVWAVLSFLCGSLPFSPWIARLFSHRNLREVADGNPGSTNVFRSSGALAGTAALLLDAFKGALPVGWAYFHFRFPLAWMVVIAVAPVLGHAFSPFLKGRGGKAVAVTFGIWAGLTLGEAPLMLGLFALVWLVVLQEESWAVLACMLGLLAHFLLNHFDWLYISVWAGNFAVLVWKHRAGLARRPHFRSWLRFQLRWQH